MEKIRIDELVMDYNLYPRTEINSINVKDIMNSLEAGIEIPPILVDRKSKRVIDGFHRLTALKRLKMEMCPVTWKDCKNDGELYMEAVRHNAKHGQKLSRYDHTRIITTAQNMGIELEVIADALSITKERISELMLEKTAIGPDDKIVPIKGTARHLAGKHITKRQEKGNEVATGWTASYYADQLINIIQNDLLPKEDAKTIEKLMKLKKLLKKVLEPRKKRAAA